jgi:hypothetical protein
MSYVRVTFKMDVTDPDDQTGLTEEEFDNVMNEIPMTLGGYDVEVAKVNE